jgi:hypothetical protein
MAEIGLAPAPLDRFKYVVVKKFPYKYDARGRKTELSVGDRMEYADRAAQLGMDIDMFYYMESGICGQLARFICYRPEFYVEPTGPTEEEFKISEEKNIDKAKKWVLNFYKRWNVKDWVDRGPALKSLYKHVSKTYNDTFAGITKINSSLLWKLINPDESGKGDDSATAAGAFYESIFEGINHRALMAGKTGATRWLKQHNTNNGSAEWCINLRAEYQAILAARKLIYNARVPGLRDEMRKHLQAFAALLAKRDTVMQAQINQIAKTLGIVDEANIQALDKTMATIQNYKLPDVEKTLLNTFSMADLQTIIHVENLHSEIYGITVALREVEYIVSNLEEYIKFKLSRKSQTNFMIDAHHDPLADIDHCIEEVILL